LEGGGRRLGEGIVGEGMVGVGRVLEVVEQLLVSVGVVLLGVGVLREEMRRSAQIILGSMISSVHCGPSIQSGSRVGGGGRAGGREGNSSVQRDARDPCRQGAEWVVDLSGVGGIDVLARNLSGQRRVGEATGLAGRKAAGETF